MPMDRTAPVSQEKLKRLAELAEQRTELGLQLLDLESARVRVLVQARATEVAHTAIFHEIAEERGLPVDFPLNVDAATGAIELRAEPPANPTSEAAPSP